MAVRVHPEQRRIVWTALTGPSYTGSVHLEPLDSGWTRATVELSCWPDGFTSGVAELLLPGASRAGIDEAGLSDLLGGDARVAHP
ncbi:hypothetical protein ACIB24_10205 [Spongisporangium articulatum]|uniref:Uncharacterized protein n=1 Tax=Spongisporangium articulatum TaxID=3362603 RepID=A0ABW8AMW3_9ACTN